MKINGVNLVSARQSFAARSSDSVKVKARRADRVDVLSLSQEARKAALAQIEELRRRLVEANKQADEKSEGFEAVRKCMLIAMRIMNGDKVPFKDQQYLKKHQPEMYAQAILMRRKNDDPKEHKSVLRCRDRRKSRSGEQNPAIKGKALEMLPTADDGQQVTTTESATKGTE